MHFRKYRNSQSCGAAIEHFADCNEEDGLFDAWNSWDIVFFEENLFLKICFIDPNRKKLDHLKSLLSGLPGLEFKGIDTSVESGLPHGLDAVFLTLTAAERWKHDPLARVMQVLTVPAEQRGEGYPPFIITGRALMPHESRDALSQDRVILEETLTAARKHNELHQQQIRTIGFRLATLTSSVTLEELPPLVREVFKDEN